MIPSTVCRGNLLFPIDINNRSSVKRFLCLLLSKTKLLIYLVDRISRSAQTLTVLISAKSPFDLNSRQLFRILISIFSAELIMLRK